ncbi:MAG: S41 family peptidase [Parachlamydiales bacterium]|jgi:carboxyl-terminal processing protease
MNKKIFLLLLLFPIIVFTKPTNLSDINKVMATIFDYHIDQNKYDEVLIERSFKIFIDQFDSLKIYLIENEVASYLDLNANKTKEILEKVRNGDFSDYTALHKVFKKSILRAREARSKIIDELIQNDSIISKTKNSFTSYSISEEELYNRQKNIITSYFSNQKKRSAIDTLERKKKAFNLLERKLSRNEDLYLEESENVLSQNILKAYTKSMDAHSYFFTEEEAEQMRLSLEKEFEGIGVVLSESVDGVIVSDLVENSPAKDSGLIKINDILTEVNGQSVEFLGFDQVMKLMKGKDSPSIVLGFKRIQNDENNSFWKIKLDKKPISMDEQRLSATYENVDNGIIGKLDLKSFYENLSGITSEKDIKTGIKKLRKVAEVKGLILDLRENAGGFLSQAIKVASLFVKNGVIVISKNSKKEIKFLRNLEGEAFYNGPLIILTSKLSASASEIVAAALQDYGVALIVGDETTFGKGSIQYQTVTDKKADYFFKVTVGKYYTVSGKTTQIEGVKADIVVPSNFSAYKIGERYLQYPLKADKMGDVYNDKLTDIDSKIKGWFKQNYTPNLQKRVNFWQKMVPTLKANSEKRIANDPNFQKFLKKQELIKAKIEGEEIEVSADDSSEEDYQMKEAVNILKDMINFEADQRKASGL